MGSPRRGKSINSPYAASHQRYLVRSPISKYSSAYQLLNSRQIRYIINPNRSMPRRKSRNLDPQRHRQLMLHQIQSFPQPLKHTQQRLVRHFRSSTRRFYGVDADENSTRDSGNIGIIVFSQPVVPLVLDTVADPADSAEDGGAEGLALEGVVEEEDEVDFDVGVVDLVVVDIDFLFCSDRR